MKCGANKLAVRAPLARALAFSLLLALTFVPALAAEDSPQASAPASSVATAPVATASATTAPAATATAIVAGCGWPADQALNAGGAGDAAHRWARLAAYCAMAPEFQIT